MELLIFSEAIIDDENIEGQIALLYAMLNGAGEGAKLLLSHRSTTIMLCYSPHLLLSCLLVVLPYRYHFAISLVV
jgi:ankyrin repeat protein